MVDGSLSKAQGAGRTKVHAVAVTLTDGGTHETGLQEVSSASATASTAAEIASVTDITGGTITVAIKGDDGTAGTEQTIYIDAKGV